MLHRRGQLLRAALGFAGLPRPSYDRSLWALRSWLDSWSAIGRIAVGMHRQGFDLQLTQYDERGWRAVASMKQKGAGAFIALGGAPMSTQAQIIRFTTLAAKAKLPGVFPSRGYVRNGGLLGYGPGYEYRWKTAATYVDKILKGAKPNELPVQQPREFELAINLKTAKAVGVTIPQSLLLRANEIIE